MDNHFSLTGKIIRVLPAKTFTNNFNIQGRPSRCVEVILEVNKYEFIIEFWNGVSELTKHLKYGEFVRINGSLKSKAHTASTGRIYRNNALIAGEVLFEEVKCEE